MTQFGIAHVAILCAGVMTMAWVLDIYPFFVAMGAIAVMLYYAFAKK